MTAREGLLARGAELGASGLALGAAGGEAPTESEVRVRVRVRVRGRGRG